MSRTSRRGGASRWLALLLLTPLLSHCDCGRKDEPAAHGEEPALMPSDRLQARMRAHADLARSTRNALVRGELRVAQQNLDALASLLETTRFPEQGDVYAAQVRSVAAEARAAGNLKEASMGFARLSQRCGECHHALNRGPPMKLEPPPGGTGIRNHMMRHGWAVDRMWEALLSNSTLSFQAAARVLAEAPMHGNTDPDLQSPPGTVELANRVHDLAFVAAVDGTVPEDEYIPMAGETLEDPPSTRDQAELYGTLLYTCSQCHRLLEVRPRLDDATEPAEALPR